MATFRLKWLAAAGLLGLAWAVSAAERSAAGERLAVLFYVRGPQSIDFPELKSLQAREGFAVDYTGTVRQADVALTWELVKNFNCVVVVDGALGGVHQEQGAIPAAFDVLDRFLKAGGGVLIAHPGDIGDAQGAYRQAEAVLWPRYGASYLRRQALRERDPAKAAVRGYFQDQYFFTGNMAAHPVTQGVRGVWYPAIHREAKGVPGERGFPGYALKLSQDWAVVLRGADTACTTLEEVRFQTLDMPAMESTAICDREPPLFAVRSVANGRMAFFVMLPRFHFTAGTHRNVEGGMDAMTGGIVLEKGIDGRPSDFGLLLANTIRWLGEPSLGKGKLGGYRQEAARLAEPDPGPSPRVNWAKLQFPSELPPAMRDPAGRPLDLSAWNYMDTVHSTPPNFWLNTALPKRTFRGLIGARSALSGGSGSVAEYGAAASAAGLDYLVFLETFEKMTPEKLADLKSQCQKASTGRLLLLPGLYIQDNRGHHQYYFGNNDLVWPGPEYLTADGTRFDTSARAESSGLPHITFVLSHVAGKNTIGYFALAGAVDARMWNLKLYNSVGLFHYANGRLVDGLEENREGFLEVNNSGCNIFPMSIDLLNSPDELGAAVKAGHLLTCAKAGMLSEVPVALRYEYLRDPVVFVSNGPDLVEWSTLNRDYFSHAESGITPNYRFPVKLHVRSAVGLKEILIRDGLKEFARILPGGVKDFVRIFELSHNQQKNLILEVRDLEDRVAVSAEQFDRNHLNMHYWCGDRINGSLKHGPLYFFGSYGESGLNFVSKGQDSFDLFASPGKLPELPFASSAGQFQINRLANRPLQALVSEDAGVYLNSCSMYFPESEKLWSVWGTYGPLFETGLFDYLQTYISFRNRFARPNPYIPTLAGVAESGDVVPGLNQTEFVFKQDQTLASLPVDSLTYGSYGTLAANEMIVCLCPDARSLPLYGRLKGDYPRWERLLNNPDQPFRIDRGGFWCAYGSRPGAATRIQYNLGAVPIVVRAEAGGLRFLADVEGREVRKGEALTIKLLGLTGPAPEQNGGWRYRSIADFLGLDGTPGYALNLVRGRVLPITEGICDLEAVGGTVEFKLPKPAGLNLQLVLPVRVQCLNSRWSAWCYDVPAKRGRPLGLYHGTAYARFDPFYTELTHVMLGHPVVCDRAEVVILLTQLAEAPGRYWLAVNNPGDKPVKTVLKQAIPLPGLALPDTPVELAPGQFLKILPEAD